MDYQGLHYTIPLSHIKKLTAAMPKMLNISSQTKQLSLVVLLIFNFCIVLAPYKKCRNIGAKMAHTLFVNLCAMMLNQPQRRLARYQGVQETIVLAWLLLAKHLYRFLGLPVTQATFIDITLLLKKTSPTHQGRIVVKQRGDGWSWFANKKTTR